MQEVKGIAFTEEGADFVMVQLHELDTFQETQANEKFSRITNTTFKYL